MTCYICASNTCLGECEPPIAYIGNLEREVAELKEQLHTELKRVNSYKNLVASLEGQVSHYSQKDYSLSKPRLDGLEQSLASEQEMNEVLTNENTELQAHNNVLREALEEITAKEHTEENEWDAVEVVIPAIVDIAKQALASTPAQSLQAHDNEILTKEREEIIATLEYHGSMFADEVCEDYIRPRLLKGKL